MNTAINEYLSKLDVKTQASQKGILERYIADQVGFYANLSTLAKSTQKNYLAVVSAFENFKLDSFEAKAIIDQKTIEIREKRIRAEKIDAEKKIQELAIQRENLSKLLAEAEAKQDFEGEPIPDHYVQWDPVEYIPEPHWATIDLIGQSAEYFEAIAEKTDKLIMVGPAGTGKTENVLKLFAKKRKPLFKVACTSDMTANDIFVSKTLTIENQKQVVKTVAGMVAKAILTANVTGEAAILFDEIATLPPLVQKMINPLVDNTRIVDLPSGRLRLRQGAKLWVFGTMNEANTSGTNPLNTDFIDRFNFMRFEKLKSHELKILLKDLSIEDWKAITDIKNDYDELQNNNEINNTIEFATRSLLQFQKFRVSGTSFRLALNLVLMDKIFDQSDKGKIRQMVEQYIP